MPYKRAKRRTMAWSRQGRPAHSRVPLGSPLHRIHYVVAGEQSLGWQVYARDEYGHSLASDTIFKTKAEAERFADFQELLTKDTVTEREIGLLMQRINAGKIKPSELVMKRYEAGKEEGWKLTPEQLEKARHWWLKNKRFMGYREEEVIENLKAGYLVDFYSPDGRYYYPYYRFESDEGKFEYAVVGGEPQIMG